MKNLFYSELFFFHEDEGGEFQSKVIFKAPGGLSLYHACWIWADLLSWLLVARLLHFSQHLLPASHAGSSGHFGEHA